MNKLFKSIVAASVGVAMAIGVGVGLGREAKAVYATTQEIALTDIGKDLSSTANTTASTVSVTATGTTDSYVLNYFQCKKQTNSSKYAMFMVKNVGAYISNHTAIPGAITKLELFILTGAAGGTTYDVAFGTTEFDSAVSGVGAVNITGGNSHEFSNNVSGARYFCVKLGNSNNGQVLGMTITYEAEGGDPTPATYTGVEVSQKTALTGTYKGEAFYECQATVSGTGAYSSSVTWSITSTNTYGSGTSITNVASIDANGKITFLDNVNAIYVWATAADGTTHNTTGFSVTASGLLDDTIPSWTKITDSNDISVNKVYALSNDGTNFGEASVISNQISLTTKLSKVGYIVLESVADGYYARFATYENSAWVVDTGKYVNYSGDSTKLSSSTTASTVWTLVEDSSNGVYLKISGGRHLGLGTNVIKAYADVNANAPVYLWEVDSLPVIACASIQLNGAPNSDMSIGDKATLSYTAHDSNSDPWVGDVTYSISNEKDTSNQSTTGVVELSATSGASVTLTAKKAGSARVSVQDKDQNADASYVDITVLPDPERIELPNGSYTVVIDASKEESSTLPSSRDYEIKEKNGRTWYQNLTVNFSGISVLTNYHEYESAKTTGALTVTNNSNARISSVEVHYYKYENEGVGIYVDGSILTPTSSTGTSGTDNDLYRGYTNIAGNTFALCNKNSDYTNKFYTVTITLTVADENEEFLSLVINKGNTATSFTEGDAPNATGLTVYENYTTDGSTISRSEDVTASVTWNYSIETIAAKTTSYTVTATYGGHTSTAVTIDGFTVTPIAKYSLFTSQIIEGDYVIYYSGKVMKNTIESNRTTYSEANPVNDTILTNATDIIWHIAPSGEYFTIFNLAENKYLASTGTKNQAALVDSAENDKALWDITVSNEEFEFVNKYNSEHSINANLRYNSGYGFACYATGTGGALSLYRKLESYIPSATSITGIRGEATVVDGQVTADRKSVV